MATRPSTMALPPVPLSLNILAHPFRFSVSPAQSRYPVTFSQSLLRRPRGQKVGLNPFGCPGSTMAEYHRIEYNWVKGVESLEEYQPGGYHPVMVGDILQDR
jgi:serine/threonine-protein kinase SRPK3